MKFIYFIVILAPKRHGALMALICVLSAMASSVYASDSLTINSSAEVILDSTSAITVSGGITGTGTLTCNSANSVEIYGDGTNLNWGIANFTPGTSSLGLYGEPDDRATIIVANNNKTFYNLIIGINATVTDVSVAGIEITQALTITSEGALNLGNNLTHTFPLSAVISGTLNLGLSTLVCNGNLIVPAGAMLVMEGSSTGYRPQLKMADGKSLEIDGTLSVGWASGNLKPVITATATGARYTFTVNGKMSANGLIIASTVNGLNITASADKTSDLDNVEFTNTGTNTRHLYVGFTAGSYLGNYDGCSFDSSFGAGNNIVAANTAGSTLIYLSTWSGAGGGESYDLQGTNCNIVWIQPDVMVAHSPAGIVMEGASGLTIPGDFNVDVVTCTGPADIYVSGVWGVVTFTPGSSTVHFNGATQDVRLGSGTTSFYSVDVQSSDGKTSIGNNIIIAPNGVLSVSPQGGARGNYTIDGSTITLGQGASITVNANAKLKAINNASFTSSNPGTDRFAFNVNGSIELSNCAVTSTNGQGLNIQSGATIDGLTDIRFYSHPGGATDRFLTIGVPNIDRSFLGCWFDTITSGYNVSATAASAIYRFETYNAGPGAGKTYTYDDDPDGDGVANTGGAVVQWLSKVAFDVASAGGVQGFPTVAFDLNTYAYYSTYVVAQDVAGLNTSDRLYVLDVNGSQKYYYEVRQKYGNIVYIPWWYTEGTTHTVYFGTSGGYLFRLVDTGAGLVLSSGWPIKASTEITSAVISDGINLYFGGMAGATPKIYAYNVTTLSQVFALTASSRLATTPSWAIDAGTTYLFIGSDMPTPLLYRVNVNNKVIDKQNTSPTDNVRASMVYWEYGGNRNLYVGDYAGRMHSVEPFSAEFITQSGFPALPSYGPYSITTMAYIKYLTASTFRIIYTDMGGWFYDRNMDGTLYNPGSGAYPIQLGGGMPIESSPLSGNSGLVYAGNNDGKVFAIDEAQKIVVKTYSFGAGIKIGDFGYDNDNSRLLVPTSTGQIYYVQD